MNAVSEGGRHLMEDKNVFSKRILSHVHGNGHCFYTIKLLHGTLDYFIL